MFLKADWTQPQIGGLLSEIIEKEERQLRDPKPRIHMQHVWDPNALAERATLWKDVQARPQQANIMELTRSKLGLSVPSMEDSAAGRKSRSKMLAERRNADSLAAMQRDRDADARSSEAGFKSAASLFTSDDLQKLRPIYAPNERLATETTNAIIGLGAKQIPVNKSRFNRQRAFPEDFTNCRNNPDRNIVERGLLETRTTPKPWINDTRGQYVRSTTSAFMLRPGETRIE